MAYLLFVDESGIDHSESPYDILAGICVKDINLWSLIQEIKKIQEDLFCDYYRIGQIELKVENVNQRLIPQISQTTPAKISSIAFIDH